MSMVHDFEDKQSLVGKEDHERRTYWEHYYDTEMEALDFLTDDGFITGVGKVRVVDIDELLETSYNHLIYITFVKSNKPTESIWLTRKMAARLLAAFYHIIEPYSLKTYFVRHTGGKWDLGSFVKDGSVKSRVVALSFGQKRVDVYPITLANNSHIGFLVVYKRLNNDKEWETIATSKVRVATFRMFVSTLDKMINMSTMYQFLYKFNDYTDRFEDAISKMNELNKQVNDIKVRVTNIEDQLKNGVISQLLDRLEGKEKSAPQTVKQIDAMNTLVTDDADLKVELTTDEWHNLPEDDSFDDEAYSSALVDRLHIHDNTTSIFDRVKYWKKVIVVEDYYDHYNWQRIGETIYDRGHTADGGAILTLLSKEIELPPRPEDWYMHTEDRKITPEIIEHIKNMMRGINKKTSEDITVKDIMIYLVNSAMLASEFYVKANWDALPDEPEAVESKVPTNEEPRKMEYEPDTDRNIVPGEEVRERRRKIEEQVQQRLKVMQMAAKQKQQEQLSKIEANVEDANIHHEPDNFVDATFLVGNEDKEEKERLKEDLKKQEQIEQQKLQEQLKKIEEEATTELEVPDVAGVNKPVEFDPEFNLNEEQRTKVAKSVKETLNNVNKVLYAIKHDKEVTPEDVQTNNIDEIVKQILKEAMEKQSSEQEANNVQSATNNVQNTQSVTEIEQELLALFKQSEKKLLEKVQKTAEPVEVQENEPLAETNEPEIPTLTAEPVEVQENEPLAETNEPEQNKEQPANPVDIEQLGVYAKYARLLAGEEIRLWQLTDKLEYHARDYIVFTDIYHIDARHYYLYDKYVDLNPRYTFDMLYQNEIDALNLPDMLKVLERYSVTKETLDNMRGSIFIQTYYGYSLMRSTLSDVIFGHYKIGSPFTSIILGIAWTAYLYEKSNKSTDYNTLYDMFEKFSKQDPLQVPDVLGNGEKYGWLPYYEVLASAYGKFDRTMPFDPGSPVFMTPQLYALDKRVTIDNYQFSLVDIDISMLDKKKLPYLLFALYDSYLQHHLTRQAEDALGGDKNYVFLGERVLSTLKQQSIPVILGIIYNISRSIKKRKDIFADALNKVAMYKVFDSYKDPIGPICGFDSKVIDNLQKTMFAYMVHFNQLELSGKVEEGIRYRPFYPQNSEIGVMFQK